MGIYYRKVNQRNLQCQNIAELTNAILEEWRQFPLEAQMSLYRSPDITKSS